MTESTRDFFETLAKVLLRCWILGFLLLLTWFALAVAAEEFIFRVHGGLFGFTLREMNLIFYCGMGLWKLAVILFFFFPWLAIRLVLGRKQ